MRARLSAFFQKNRLSILLIVLIFVGSGVFTYWYVASEKAFYVWDNDSYQTFTGDLLLQFQTSIQAGIRTIVDATQSDYNLYYCLPLLPVLLITGNTRQAYEISLVIIYLIPFILVTGLIGRRLIAGPPRRVFWLVVGIGLVLPVVWLPTLRGYPDTAASLALTLAIWVYLKDPTLKRVGQLISLGLLIGLAILIRRHFAYSAFAFFGAAGIVALVGFVKEARYHFGKAARKLIERVIQLSLVGIFAVLLVAVFNLQIILKVVFIDYNKLYASYLEPWPKVLGWFLDSFGWLPFGGAIVGLYLLWRKSGRKEDVLFFGLFGAFELLLWVVYVRQISIQYTLHLSVFIIIGLAGLFVSLWETVKTRFQPKMAQAGAALGVVLLSVNCLAGLFLPAATFPAALFSGNWQPLRRDDYQQVINLTKYLDEQTSWDDKIYVLASSYRFNAQTFLRADEAITGKKNEPTIQLLTSPDIDSRDFYPLEPLLDATLVVLIDPYQYHISPDQQQVVRVVYDMFKQNLELAQDFSVLNDNFVIDNQTKATIFKRARPTSVNTALKSLQIMESYVRQVPGNQYDWINLDPARPATVQPRVNDGTALIVDRSQWKSTTASQDTAGSRLVYIRPVTGKEVFQGKVIFQQAGCGEATIDFSGMDPAKSPVQFAEYRLKPDQEPTFQVDFAKIPAGQFALVEIVPSQGSATGCSLTLELTPVK